MVSKIIAEDNFVFIFFFIFFFFFQRKEGLTFHLNCLLGMKCQILEKNIDNTCTI